LARLTRPVEQCEFYGVLGGSFYRPERANREVARGGGLVGMQRLHAGCGDFQRVLAWSAAGYGVL
jgi:hypothetical protein